MSMIKCKQCLDDINTPFGFYIKKDGLCGGCHNAIKSKKTSETLLDLVQKIKEKNSGSYDCIVPCKGTAEDFFVVEKLKENNINPLLVFVNSYFNTNSAWKNFHKLIEVFDVDSRTYNPNIKKYKKIVSYMLSNHQDIFIPYKMLNYSYSKQLAAKLGVRYIVSGEFQELLTVGKFNRENNVQKTRWSMFQHDINVASEQIIGHEIDSFMENTLYDSVNDFENEQVSKWEYISNYIHWDQWMQDSYIAEKYSIYTDNLHGTFDQYYRSNGVVYYGVHDALRYIKYGHYKLRDHLSREIRHERISPENAYDLLEVFNKHKGATDLEPLKWLGSSKSGVEWYRKFILKENPSSMMRKITWEKYFNVWLGGKGKGLECFSNTSKISIFKKGL